MTKNSCEITPGSIGVFDSGLGGLTVLKELYKAMPGENFIYLGDTARLPYGSKSSQTIARYAQQNMEFLSHLGVKAIVVACNSASSTILQHQRFNDLPLYNVIIPGAKKALSASRTGRIGVLGTRATVFQQAYVKTIKKLNNAAEVFQQACPLLVPLVEEGWDLDPLTNLVIYRYLSQIMRQEVDTLILGCTHYPVLKSSISNVVGPDVAIIDSAVTVAEEIFTDMQNGVLAKVEAKQPGNITLLTTDQPTGFEIIAERLLKPVKINCIEQVDLTF